MRNTAESPYHIRALQRALAIVAEIGDAGEIPLGQLGVRLQIPKGSLLRHLRVLEAWWKRLARYSGPAMPAAASGRQ
jgi:hypothetical protein